MLGFSGRYPKRSAAASEATLGGGSIVGGGSAAVPQIGPIKALFSKTLNPVIALMIIAVADGFLFIIVGAWTVGGGETAMTGFLGKAIFGNAILHRFPYWGKVFPLDPLYWKIYISFGMLFGAFVGALLSGEFYLRLPRHLGEWTMITIGGLLMGIGIRLAFICNISTFFAVTTEMNLAGYLAVSGILAGAWVGTQIYKKALGV